VIHGAPWTVWFCVTRRELETAARWRGEVGAVPRRSRGARQTAGLPVRSQDMALQQSKLSKQRSRMRRAANRYRGLQPTKCGMCGEAIIPHRVCAKCGHYKGRQVVSVTAE